MIQSRYFKNELTLFSSIKFGNGRAAERKQKAVLRKSSSLRKLDPFIDESGIIRVGGRIRNSAIQESVKHPVILPKKGNLTIALIRSLSTQVET